MIDLDVMPPDWKFAQNHAKSAKPGKAEDLFVKGKNTSFCKCCFKAVEKEDIPLCSNAKELQFLGFGFPLYYIFLRYCIILVLILICSYSAVSLYWGIKANSAFCSHRRLGGGSEGDLHCTSFLIIFSRIEDHVDGAEMILRIASFVIHMLALIYIRDNIRKTIEYYDEKTTSLSDYSFLIKNLPKKNGIQGDIRRFVNEHFQKQWQELADKYVDDHFQKGKQKVMEIILLPDIKKFYDLDKKKKKLIQQKRQILIEQDKHTSNKVLQEAPSMTSLQQIQSPLDIVEEKIQKTIQEIEAKKKSYQDLAHKDQLHADIAIVTLNTELFKNAVVQYAEDNELNTDLLGKYFGNFTGNLQIEEAPEPNEIIWANLHYEARERMMWKFIGWALTVVFIAVITVGFYFLLLAKTNLMLHAIEGASDQQTLHKSSDYKIATFVLFLMIFLIVFFNKFILSWVLHQFAHLEKHENTADEEFSFALKYTLGLYFTTALMTLAVEDITFHNFYSHEFGVIEEESIMFFLNAFFIPLLMFVNPWQIKRVVVRYFKKEKKYYTQDEANKIMCDNTYAMGKGYAEIIETVWFTFLYATMIPLGSFISFFGLCFYYWVDKFNLLRRSSLTHNVSGEMAVVSLKLLDWTLIMKPAGELIFDSGMRDHINVASIVMTAVAFVYVLLPMDRILEFFHEEEFEQEEKSYEEVKDTFLETYQTLHPVMNHNAQEIFARLQSRLARKISLTQLSLPYRAVRQTLNQLGIIELKKDGNNQSNTSILFRNQKEGIHLPPINKNRQLDESNRKILTKDQNESSEVDMKGSKKELLTNNQMLSPTK